LKTVTLLGLALTPIASPAFAHRLDATIVSEDDAIVVTVYRDESTPAMGAVITVFDGSPGVADDTSDTAIASGRTDEHGRWSFRPTRPGALRLRIDDGSGHRREVGVEAEALRGIFDTSAPATIGRDGPTTRVLVDTRSTASGPRRSWELWVGAAVLAVLTLATSGFWIAARRRHRTEAA